MSVIGGVRFALGLAAVAACGDPAPATRDADPGTRHDCVATMSARGAMCAARADGVAFCWGAGGNGELGNGTFEYLHGGAPPTRVQIDRVAQLASGESTACAIRDDGTAACWGEGSKGQIGDGATLDRATPVDLPLTGIAELVTGQTHTCARLTDGTGYCWGDNAEGALGVPSSGIEPDPIPAPVGNALQLAITDDITCALRPDRTLECWGFNARGELGDGTTTTRSTPAPVLVPDPIDRVFGGCHAHTCAVSSLGEVWCWGDNQWGQLGRGTTSIYETVPARVVGLTGVADVAVGASHSCARKIDGSVWCWGANDAGALGDGGFDASSTPVQVVSLGGPIVTLETACGSSYALRDDGVLLGWGGRGNFGVDEPLNQPVPRMIPIPCP